jgi:hypothetical protein
MGAVTDPEISVSGVNYINTQEKKSFFFPIKLMKFIFVPVEKWFNCTFSPLFYKTHRNIPLF